ncbi:hypothetical protein ACC735_39995, partial [Rhizobium ruizarguesonis]
LALAGAVDIGVGEHRDIDGLADKRATDPSVLIAANYPVLLRDAIVTQLNVNAASRPEGSVARLLFGSIVF